MKCEDILSTPAKVLSQEQREFYFENGYLLVEKLLSDDLIAHLKEATDRMIALIPEKLSVASPPSGHAMTSASIRFHQTGQLATPPFMLCNKKKLRDNFHSLNCV